MDNCWSNEGQFKSSSIVLLLTTVDDKPNLNIVREPINHITGFMRNFPQSGSDSKGITYCQVQAQHQLQPKWAELVFDTFLWQPTTRPAGSDNPADKPSGLVLFSNNSLALPKANMLVYKKEAVSLVPSYIPQPEKKPVHRMECLC